MQINNDFENFKKKYGPIPKVAQEEGDINDFIMGPSETAGKRRSSKCLWGFRVWKDGEGCLFALKELPKETKGVVGFLLTEKPWEHGSMAIYLKFENLEESFKFEALRKNIIRLYG